MTPNPYESPNVSGSQVRSSISIRPNRRAVFVALLMVALIAGLFLPTFELFKGRMSLGRAPLWLAYVGLGVAESWPMPIAIIGAHWMGALVVAWFGDRLVDILIGNAFPRC